MRFKIDLGDRRYAEWLHPFRWALPFRLSAFVSRLHENDGGTCEQEHL